MNEDRVRRSDTPDEPLAFMAEAMTNLVPDEGVEAIVMLHDIETDRAVMHLTGFETEADAVAAIFVHLQAIFESNGQGLAVIPYSVPPN